MAYEENVTIDEGVSKNGIRTEFSFEGGDVVIKKTFDAEPHLKHAENARQQTQGMNWGEGRLVGHIPPLFYAKIMGVSDSQLREKMIMDFFRENKAFVMFDRFNKDL